MYKRCVIQYFDSAAAVARALGINRASISSWSDVIPEKRALQIERITSGALTYDSALYTKSPLSRNSNLPDKADVEEGDIDLAEYYNV